MLKQNLDSAARKPTTTLFTVILFEHEFGLQILSEHIPKQLLYVNRYQPKARKVFRNLWSSKTLIEHLEEPSTFCFEISSLVRGDFVFDWTDNLDKHFKKFKLSFQDIPTKQNQIHYDHSDSEFIPP